MIGMSGEFDGAVTVARSHRRRSEIRLHKRSGYCSLDRGNASPWYAPIISGESVTERQQHPNVVNYAVLASMSIYIASEPAMNLMNVFIPKFCFFDDATESYMKGECS